MSDKSLYFISLIPPKREYEIIKGFQKVMSEQFDSHKSFGHIPHLTLVPPFHVDDDKEAEVRKIIDEITFEPFSLKLKGFGYFKKHTIFIKVEENKTLEKLHFGLIRKLNQAPGLLSKQITYFQLFKPHITIAYRDLETNFKQAWEYFQHQNIEEHFDVNEISLLKHDGEKWEIIG